MKTCRVHGDLVQSPRITQIGHPRARETLRESGCSFSALERRHRGVDEVDVADGGACSGHPVDPPATKRAASPQPSVDPSAIAAAERRLAAEADDLQIRRNLVAERGVCGRPPPPGIARAGEDDRLPAELRQVANELERSLNPSAAHGREVVRKGEHASHVDASAVHGLPHDPGRRSGRDRESGNVVFDHGVRADDRAPADADAGTDDHVLPEPRAVPDLDWCDGCDALLEYRRASHGERMGVVCDVDAARDENLLAEADGSHS